MNYAHSLRFALVLFLFPLVTHAQDYLITAKGDSLTGELKIFTLGVDKKVQVNDNKKKTQYSLFQIRSFRFRGDIYHPVKGPAGYTFMKLLRPGYVSLYGYQMENQMTFDGLYVQKKDGTGIEVPNLSFKKAMRKFLTECPAVATKLDNDAYSRKDLTVLLDEYNSCIDLNSEDRNKAIATKKEQTKKASPWAALEQKVQESPEFKGKADAIEMIQEIRNKISKCEKVPNFMIEGLKSSLADTAMTEELNLALAEL